MDLQWLKDLAGIDPGKTVYRGPGLTVGEKAMTRVGRAPVTFSRDSFSVGGKDAHGEFDPNDGSIKVAAGGSPRRVSRTLAHEDIHNVFQKQFPDQHQANERLTHGITGIDQDGRRRAIEELRSMAQAEGVDVSDLERLIRMFDAADSVLAR